MTVPAGLPTTSIFASVFAIMVLDRLGDISVSLEPHRKAWTRRFVLLNSVAANGEGWFQARAFEFL